MKYYNNSEYRNVECSKDAGQPMPDVNSSSMGESLDRLEKECCVLQEQLFLFRDKVQPLLKPFPEPSELACDENVKACKIPYTSPRTSQILAITERLRDMQNFVDLLARDIDL